VKVSLFSKRESPGLIDAYGRVLDILNDSKTLDMNMRSELQCILMREINYSLRSILPFANTNVFSTKMCLDTSIFMKGNMNWRE
jgi:hypothetical protein